MIVLIGGPKDGNVENFDPRETEALEFWEEDGTHSRYEPDPDYPDEWPVVWVKPPAV